MVKVNRRLFYRIATCLLNYTRNILFYWEISCFVLIVIPLSHCRFGLTSLLLRYGHLLISSSLILLPSQCSSLISGLFVISSESSLLFLQSRYLRPDSFVKSNLSSPQLLHNKVYRNFTLSSESPDSGLLLQLNSESSLLEDKSRLVILLLLHCSNESFVHPLISISVKLLLLHISLSSTGLLPSSSPLPDNSPLSHSIRCSLLLFFKFSFSSLFSLQSKVFSFLIEVKLSSLHPFPFIFNQLMLLILSRLITVSLLPSSSSESSFWLLDKSILPSLLLDKNNESSFLLLDKLISLSLLSLRNKVTRFLFLDKSILLRLLEFKERVVSLVNFLISNPSFILFPPPARR